MAKNLLIVESPAKAKTIEKILGKDFIVKSSYGHIRDLIKDTNNRILLASSSEEQLSNEDENNGLFTKTLIKLIKEGCKDIKCIKNNLKWKEISENK